MGRARFTKESPVIIRRRGTLVEVERAETGDVLAHCRIGDDASMEAIADILSAKGLPREAMAMRQLMMDARRPLGPTGRTGKGPGVGYLKDPRDAH